MSEDFPCFACGSEGPHQRITLQWERRPSMTDAEWEAFDAACAASPPLIYCGACHHTIWEPDPGDGVVEPNLTMIRPGLRDLAHQALAERNFPRFLILAEGHHRSLLAEDNILYFRQRAVWDDVILAMLRLDQPD